MRTRSHTGKALLAMGLLWLPFSCLRAAPLPGGFAHSGWFQFELVVLIDTQATTLAGEAWPLLPSVGYPARWRWLTDSALIESLADAYPDAALSASPSGQIMVRLPQTQPSDWIPPEPDPALEPEQDAPHDYETGAEHGTATTDVALGEAPYPEQPDLSDESMTAGDRGAEDDTATTSAATEPPADERDAASDQPASSQTLLPIETLQPRAETSALVALEDLNPIDLFPKPREQQVLVPFAMPLERPELTEVTVAARAIPTPEAFALRPMQQLASGLRRYLATSDDQLMVSAAWLQGPESDTLPLLLEPHSESGFPALQGFVQLLPRGNTFRLGVNFWANTAGDYLPDRFNMPGPPASPQRVVLIAPPPIPVISDIDDDAPEHLSQHANATTDANLRVSADGWLQHSSDRLAPLPPEWPWRHLIHVADTVTLEEERIRYLDHPVIKVIATWREWSWYELFLQGRELAASAQTSEVSEPAVVSKDQAIPGGIMLPPQL